MRDWLLHRDWAWNKRLADLKFKDVIFLILLVWIVVGFITAIIYEF
jgi:hypothetical protein